MHYRLLRHVILSLGGALLAAALSACGGSDGPPTDQVRGTLAIGLAPGFKIADMATNGFTEERAGVHTSNFSATVAARDDYFKIVDAIGDRPLVELIAEKGDIFKLHGAVSAEQKGEDWDIRLNLESVEAPFIIRGAGSRTSRSALVSPVVKGSESHENLIQARERRAQREAERQAEHEQQVWDAEREAHDKIAEQTRQKERELMEQLQDQVFEAIVSNDHGLRGSMGGAARTELVLSIEERDARQRTFTGEAVDLSEGAPRVFQYEASVQSGPIVVFEGDFGETQERLVINLWNEGGALAQAEHVARLLPMSEGEAAEIFATIDMLTRGHTLARNMGIQARTLPAIRRAGVEGQYRVRSPIVEVTATGDVDDPERWTDGHINASRTTERLPEGGGRVEFRLSRPEMAHGVAMYFSRVPDERPEFAADPKPRHFPIRFNGGPPLSWPMPKEDDRGVLLMFEKPMPVGSFTFEETQDDVTLSEVQFLQRAPEPSG